MAHRIERLNSLIRQELSELLQLQVKDPRLGNFIAVTEVEVTPDLKYAKVFVSSMTEETDRKEVLAALSSAAGFFRTRLAKNLKMRRTPELTFQWDDSIERGDRLLRLIDEVSRNEINP
ncbi:MAG: 30S ribosome-binding factor RbfA [Dehalococcoidales bacterium]|nr:30S ribosome-binding factor RbfA [Dehalococcoidales bacterium]